MFATTLGLVLAATLLAPGLIFRNFRARFLSVPESQNSQEAFLGLAVIGLWNLAMSWPILLVLGVDPLGPMLASTTIEALVESIRDHAFVWMLQILVSPVILAILSAYIARRGWIDRALSGIGLLPRPRHPDAWDAAFQFHGEWDTLATVMLEDGVIIYGRLGPDSVASSVKEHHTVFLDMLYHVDPKSGDLVADQTSSGIVITKGIRWVVFSELPPEDDEPEDEDDTEDTTSHG